MTDSNPIQSNSIQSNSNWAAVPVLVRDLYVKYAGDAWQLARGKQNHPLGWVLVTEEIGPVLVKRAVETPLGDTADIDASQLHEIGSNFLPSAGKAFRGAQSLIGGPNPLTSMLLTGALTGGLGYGAGWLLNKLFPKAFNKRTPRAFGLLGGLGGAGSNFLLHGVPALKHQGIKGLVTQQPLQGGKPYADTVGIPEADYAAGSDMARMTVGGKWNTGSRQWDYPDSPSTGQYGPVPDPEYYKRYNKPGASSHLAGVLDRLTAELGVECPAADFEKHALAGAEYLEAIPTDEWGRVVMRDPFLEHPEKAIVAGLPAAAGAMRGSRWVSPRDVASVAANAGLGYGYGYLGSLAAKFMGLTEPLQKGIQRAGLLAGAIRGIIGMV